MSEEARMARTSRWSALAAVTAIVGITALVTPAYGDSGGEKAALDARLRELRAKLAETSRGADILTAEITAVASQVRTLESQVSGEQSRLVEVEGTLARERRTLASLTERLREQSGQLVRLRSEYGVALVSLERRVRQIYVAETPDPVAFVLGASSFSDIIDNVDMLDRIGRQDERILNRVVTARVRMAALRRRTASARAQQAELTERVAARVSEQRAVRDTLIQRRDELAATERLKSAALGAIQSRQAALGREADAVAAESADLAKRIAAAQAAAQASAAADAPTNAPTDAAPIVASGSGTLRWPVNGTLTSTFGTRWGRLHEGLDITAPPGTPVVAAAAGRVISAGWSGGYGNLVVIDHGNGLATAYAHNASVTVSVGQDVSAGQTIATVGSTGNSTGPHVHFEVRVGGAAVDPLGYL